MEYSKYRRHCFENYFMVKTLVVSLWFCDGDGIGGNKANSRPLTLLSSFKHVIALIFLTAKETES